MFINISFIDSFIVIAFLLIALLIGVRTGINVKTLDDYIYYHKKFNPAFIGLSLSMVVFGSGTIFGTFVEVKKLGIIYAVASLGYVINSLITAKFIIPKMDNRFENMISVCDMFKYFYGKETEKFAACIAVIFDIGAISTHLIITGKLISYCFNFNPNISIIISSVIMLTYSCLGGIRAVTVLDAMKCVLMLIFIPILANFITFDAGGILSILKNVPEGYLSIYDNKEFSKYLTLFIFFTLPTHMFQPVVIQRILLIDNKTIASNAMYIYALIRAALIWMITLIALASLILNPQDNLISTITSSLPPILQGFTLSTVLIIVMGKADAHLNSVGMVLTKNILSTFNSNYSNIKVIRLSTFLAGIVASFVAIGNFSVVSIIIFVETLWSTCVGLPLILGILGFITNKVLFKKYLILITPIFLLLQSKFSYYTPLLANGIGLVIFLFLYLTNFYNHVINYETEKNKFLSKAFFVTKKTIDAIFTNLPSISKLVRYSTNKVEQVNADYFAFSVFSCVIYTLPYFMGNFTSKSINYVIILRASSLLLCLILMLKSFWPEKLKKYFPLYWHTTLLFTLPFVTFFILMLEQWSIICLINSVLSIFLLALLTDWLSFIIITISGILLAVISYIFILGPIMFSSEVSTNYLFIYTYIFSLLIAIIFTRRKEASFDQKLGVARLLGGVVAHELRTNLLIIRNYTESIKENIYLDHYKNSKSSSIETDEPYKKLIIGTENIIKKSFSFIDILLTNIRGPFIQEEKEKNSIQDCIAYVMDNYPATEKEKNLIFHNKNNDFIFMGNKEIIVHIIFNLLNNSLYYSSSRENLCIQIFTYLNDKYNYLVFRDNGPGISPKNINKIFEKFFTINKKGTGLGLSFCKIAMNMLKGEIICNSVEGNHTEFILKFPKVI